MDQRTTVQGGGTRLKATSAQTKQVKIRVHQHFFLSSRGLEASPAKKKKEKLDGKIK